VKTFYTKPLKFQVEARRIGLPDSLTDIRYLATFVFPDSFTINNPLLVTGDLFFSNFYENPAVE